MSSSQAKVRPRFADWSGPLTPFALFARPEPSRPRTTTSTGAATFPRYRDLPQELVLGIYEFCDAATLFQLMRACPVGRRAAEKLFWAHPDIWYHVSAQWLVKEAGFTGGTWHCAQFARFVHQIEVGFRHRTELYFRRDPLPCTYRSFYNLDYSRYYQRRGLLEVSAQAKRFWENIRLHFPAVRHVVLSSAVPDDPATHGIVPDLHAHLTREKPPQVTLSVSYLPGVHLHAQLGQERVIRKGVGTVREIAAPDIHRQRILLAVKRFSGPLGKIQHFFMRKDRLELRWLGIQRHRFEAYDEHHFNPEAPVSCRRCLANDCNLTFTQKGEWGLHAARSCHHVFGGDKLFGTQEFLPICCVSANTESALAEETAELRRLNEELEQEFGELREAYLQGRRENGNSFVDAVTAQLKTDHEYAHQDVTTLCRVFSRFLQYVNTPRSVSPPSISSR